MHIWKTTLKQYKDILVQWFKGTGGGSGVPKEFESWDDEKYNQYDVDPDTYDHTNISSRPPILMNLYSTHRLPYITVIHLWDHLSDGLLASKHNPLKIGSGEPGMNSSSTSSLSSTSTPDKKRKAIEESSKNVTDCMKTFIDMCNQNTKVDTPTSTVDNMSIDELYKLMDQQKSHLRFLKEMDELSEEEKCDSLKKIKEINQLIVHRAGLNNTNNSTNVSH